MSSLVKAVIPAIFEGYLQFYNNLQMITTQTYSQLIKTAKEVQTFNNIPYNLGILVHQMKKDTAKQIFDLQDGEVLDVKFNELMKANSVSSYLQCKIDEAYKILQV
ncbi:hypothetical protein SS50377_26942 [Spironucleus salmonicida]|uniref:Uncharacterized protein n=1 Tax=Spironucleus salmonicida TaxID=348837 RepID=V6LT69_9EUKA|nr:hypothetical protein SS50377_26942 [Spironucleus salmonicida]|eukprot:EST47453.1 hypothetical protein SS50377_12439 [Spironucleus salmonicida]